ncbi:MAG: hypothetical protein O3B85_02745 [Planctomycetota bacterium]|nr:hypothetical protein [Planctomycetota bacterium]
MIRRLLLASTLTAGVAAQTAWPAPELLSGLIAEHGLTEAYDALRSRLGAAARLYGAEGTPPLVATMLGSPADAAWLGAELTDRLLEAARAPFPDVPALLAECADALEVDAPRSSTVDALPEDLEPALDRVEAILAAVAEELTLALAPIPAADRPGLEPALRAVLDAFPRTVYVAEDATLSKNLALLRKVDRAALLRAAALLAPLADPGTWAPLRSKAKGLQEIDARDGVDGKILGWRETPLGPIVVGGFGANRYELDVAVLVDLGGHDTYAARTTRAGLAHPCNLVVDLWGDESYEADEDGYGAQGAATFGVSWLVDARGDDRYAAGRLAQGAGACGVGVLVDLEGDDRYAGDAYVQGAGVLGSGLWIDVQGNDRLDAALYSQGFAGPLGQGFLVDLTGDDSRRATGRYPSSYGTEGEFSAMSQGAAVGMRTLRAAPLRLAGGLGVLVDGEGDDVSDVGEFGYGMGYYLGVGIVRDCAGDDTVDASRYGIATGAHQAVGLVLDDAGDDVYRNPHAASIAGNWDHVVSILVDAAGDDVYEGGGITLGASTITSFAALIDAGGRDRYRASGMALGQAGHASDVRNGTRSVALFVDLGEAEDTYEGPFAAEDGEVRVHRREDTHEGRTEPSGVGIFVDR